MAYPIPQSSGFLPFSPLELHPRACSGFGLFLKNSLCFHTHFTLFSLGSAWIPFTFWASDCYSGSFTRFERSETSLVESPFWCNYLFTKFSLHLDNLSYWHNHFLLLGFLQNTLVVCPVLFPCLQPTSIRLQRTCFPSTVSSAGIFRISSVYVYKINNGSEAPE